MFHLSVLNHIMHCTSPVLANHSGMQCHLMLSLWVLVIVAVKYETEMHYDTELAAKIDSCLLLLRLPSVVRVSWILGHHISPNVTDQGSVCQWLHDSKPPITHSMFLSVHLCCARCLYRFNYSELTWPARHMLPRHMTTFKLDDDHMTRTAA